MLEAAVYHPAADPDACRRALARLPCWTEHAAAVERSKRLGAEAFDTLFSDGWLDLVSPRSLLPAGQRWPTLLEVARIAARGCPSSAWMIALVGGHATLAGRLPASLQQTLYASGRGQLFASASASDNSRFTWTPEGIQVDGRWRFSSGIQDATWLLLNAPCHGHPCAAPDMRWMLVLPAGAVQVLDTWSPCGMAGTGSQDVLAHAVMVPPEHAVALSELFERRLVAGAQGYLEQAPVVPYLTTAIIGPLLGCAEGAYDSHLAAMARRSPSGTVHSAELTVQVAAELACARLLYHVLLSRLHEAGCADRPPDALQLLALRRDRSYLAQLCVRVVQRLVRQQGASSLNMDDPLQRHWRDVQAMAMHRDVSWALATHACSEALPT